MKRFLVLLLSSLLLCGTVLAEPQTIDLEAMSFQELAELSRQVQLAIFESDGWQEVEVPAGIYKIGVDIPAGRWLMSSTDTCCLIYGSSIDAYNNIDVNDYILFETLYDENDSVTWDLAEGTYLHVQISPVVFTPYISSNLGFK